MLEPFGPTSWAASRSVSLQATAIGELLGYARQTKHESVW
jgi:hypothetical protein